MNCQNTTEKNTQQQMGMIQTVGYTFWNMNHLLLPGKVGKLKNVPDKESYNEQVLLFQTN